MIEFRRDFLAKETVDRRIRVEDFVDEIQLRFFESADVGIVAREIQHFLEAEQVEVGVADEVLHALQTRQCR
ncbi:hypothetical protein D3C83_167870 [compost metagenome]